MDVALAVGEQRLAGDYILVKQRGAVVGEVECDVDAVKIGMPVKVAFEPASGEIAVPVFRIAT